MAGTNFTLTKDQATQRVSQAEDILGNVKTVLQRWQEEGEHMTSTSWKGASASTFHSTTQEHGSEFQRLINLLDETIQIGHQGINTLYNADQG